MRCLRILVFVLLLSSFGTAQELTRSQKIDKIIELRSQIGALEKDVLQPDLKDITLASKQGFSAIRLMPREKYDRVLATNGGGAFYSFALKRQEYGGGSDICLERGNLRVGFAGYDYGFFYDLGEAALSEISKDINEASFLLTYKPPTTEPEIRSEQRKSREYEANGLIYKETILPVIGHTYLLRSISYDRSDLLVAFNIVRKDNDGSLIIFWKTLENFEKPTSVRNETAEK